MDHPLYARSDLIFRMLSGNYHPLFMTITLDCFNYPIQLKANDTYKCKKYRMNIGLYLERFAFWHIDIPICEGQIYANKSEKTLKVLLTQEFHEKERCQREVNSRIN